MLQNHEVERSDGAGDAALAHEFKEETPQDQAVLGEFPVCHLMPAASDGFVRDNGKRTKNAGKDSTTKLTQRQCTLLRLVVERKSSKEISRLLGVSVKTTERYRSQLMAALGIHDLGGADSVCDPDRHLPFGFLTFLPLRLLPPADQSFPHL